jgi:hypothetical protein
MMPLEIIRAEVTDETQEPVSLHDVKIYLDIDFEDWDNLLITLITAAREQVELVTGLNLIERDVTIKNNRRGYRIYPIGEVIEDDESDDKCNYTYKAGKVCPAALKACIKQRVATGFKYRENGLDEAVSKAVNESIVTELAYRYNSI